MGDPRAEALWRWFMGKTSAYVVQQSDGKYLTNGKLGLPALTPDDMEKHVAGTHTLAIYTVAEDHTVGFGMIDFDSKAPPAKERLLWIKSCLQQFGLTSYIEGSGSKGYHLWVVFKGRLPAYKVQWLMRDVVKRAEQELGAPRLNEYSKSDWIEVNPKQASGAGFGSAVKLPWGVHRKTGKHTTLINEEFNAELPNHGLDALEAQPPVTLEDLDAIIAEFCPMPAEPEQKDKTDWEHSEEFCEIAVEKLMQHCAFLKHCRDDAASLIEPHWWGMIRQLVPFGLAGRRKIHELSQAYPKYSERETDRKIDSCVKATDLKEVGPHTCLTIRGFFEGCTDDCWAPGMGVAAPAGMASKLAAQEMAQQRTGSLQVTKKGKEVKVNCVQLAAEISQAHTFKTFKDTDEIVIYRDGIYQGGGHVVIKEEVEARLGQFSTERRAAETIYHIRVSSYASREDFNRPGHFVNLNNGILDLNTQQLLPHSPQLLTTIRVPVAYDPKAKCPTIVRFLEEVLPPDNVATFLQLAGYCLESDYHISRAFLFTGEGANGKSVTIELLRTFLGKANCTTVPLQQLENSRFASSGLYGKLANLYADLPSTAMNHVGIFKMLTGGDSINAERKFQNSFDFYNHAKLIFSANQLPEVRGEDSLAFWRRWIIVRFPNQFLGDKADKHILRKLTAESELSGFLNLALASLQELRGRGEFSGAKDPEETAQQYSKSASPIVAFVTDCCTLEAEAWTSKDAVYGAYKEFCDLTSMPIKGKENFGRALSGSIYGNQIKASRVRVMGELTHGWKGLRINTNGTEPSKDVGTVGTEENDPLAF